MNILKSIRAYFPADKHQLIQLSKVTIPIVLASFLISINNFVDNFMVTGVRNGITALGLANAWTGISFSFILGVNFVSAILFGQYFGSKNIEKCREINNLRYILTIGFVLIFCIAAWSNPEAMIKVVSGNRSLDNNPNYQDTVNQASLYLRVIAISWLIISFNFSTNSILREMKKLKSALFFTFLSLVINISLNLILIPRMGSVGSAIATVIARLVVFITSYFFMFFKNRELVFVPWKAFVISKIIWIQFSKRITGALLTTGGTIATSVRIFIWPQGFPQGSIGAGEWKAAWGIGVVTILGITNTIVQALTSSFSSIQANISIFVSRLLGQNKIEEATKNAKVLKGYLFLFAVFLSALLAIYNISILHIDSFARGIERGIQETLNPDISKGQAMTDWAQKFKNAFPDSTDLKNALVQQQHLASNFFKEQVFYSGWVIIVFNPIWMWMLTSIRIIPAGGKSNISSSWEFAFGVMQTIWLVMVVFLITPNINISPEANFPISFLIFYLSDLVKFVVYEILYNKIDWAKNITRVAH
ncbi:MATE family efflux transporter [Mycoplasma sp. 1654_15]|uniref:MATE family efflux transporter n=1 Tax=Mycoplasma sp. 1654_15 TaxID=2725994 RepID=UPI00144A13BE|nr:MATE family efflux transporter [Mycoplasma sp. 1654_15]QJB70928.1 MATE family efflux transporter [Mycoplasma sp. 1654_15]